MASDHAREDTATREHSVDSRPIKVGRSSIEKARKVQCGIARWMFSGEPRLEQTSTGVEGFVGHPVEASGDQLHAMNVGQLQSHQQQITVAVIQAAQGLASI
ncbi:MAG: hypothetical protein QM805_23640 [Pseudomonas sp.]